MVKLPFMNFVLPLLIILALISVLGVLILGMISMIKGGEFNKKYGNKLMWARVVLQGLTIILLLLAFSLSNA